MRVHSFTVCDHVRQETSGKFILIGVYTNAMVFSEIPATVPLSFWCLLEPHETGTHKISFRVRMPARGEELLAIEAEGVFDQIKNWTPIGFGGNVTISHEGDMVIEARFGDGQDWQEIRTLSVTQGPLPDLGST